MKAGKVTILMLLAGMTMSFYSCSYKGECKCGSITIDGEYDNKEDYEDAKAACTLSGCDWKKTL